MTVYRDHEWRFSEEYHCMIFVRPDYDPEIEYKELAYKAPPRPGASAREATCAALVDYLMEHKEGSTRDIAATLGLGQNAVRSSLARHGRTFRVLRYCGAHAGDARAIWELV